jgi:hypothetical protein
MINYASLQASTKALIQQFQGYPVIVRLLNNTTVSTIGVFTDGRADNIDTRQHPTWTTGENGRYCLVPGIDFYNPITRTTSTPQVGGTVEYTINALQYKKTIATVDQETPIPNVPILFTLGVE